jgi:hypothetical protein
MILNGLRFSNRRLHLVSRFFATRPVEGLLGVGITAEQLHDDCVRAHVVFTPHAGPHPRNCPWAR